MLSPMSFSATDAVDENDVILKVRSYFTSDEWLEGTSGHGALSKITELEFEIERLLDEEAGRDGPTFRASDEYREGKEKLKTLRQHHESIVIQAIVPATLPAAVVPVAAGADTVPAAIPAAVVPVAAGADTAPTDPLGNYGALLDCVGDEAIKDPRDFKILLGGLRGEAAKHDDPSPWKVAGLVLYNRHAAMAAGLLFQTFDEMWEATFDRRLDARTISHFTRLTDEKRFLGVCQTQLFPNILVETTKIKLQGKEYDISNRCNFSEVELRDYFMLAFGDNLVRIGSNKGTATWWMRKWKWDESGSIVEHMVMNAIQNLFLDLLNVHRKNRDIIFHAGAADKVIEPFDKNVTTTAWNLSRYGNQQNKNVTALILSQLAAYAMEVDPFDEERHLFAFPNTVFNLKTRTFAPHFKFDFLLTNNGREWRKPTTAQQNTIAHLFADIIPDENERKGLLSVLRNGLSGFREELFIILTGGGRNGKGLIIELYQWMCGGYSKPGHDELLTKPIKSGPNTELRSLHKKRSVVWTEPEEGAVEAIRLANVKKLTGDESHDARGLYSSDSDTRIMATSMLQCNELPHILGDKGTSVRERLVVIDFPMTFTDDPQLLKEQPQTHRRKDKSLKLPAFKEEHYCALFDYLVNSYPIEGDETGLGIYITEQSKQRAGKYLDAHDFFPSWLSEHYDVLAPDPEHDEPVAFLSIKELYADFRASPQFQDMCKKEKRLMAESKFRAAITKSNAFKGFYREAKKVRIDGKCNSKDGLINVRKKRDEDDGEADAGPSAGVESGRKRGREE
jgi:hypothetical protein